jgi:hypothetical protein
VSAARVKALEVVWHEMQQDLASRSSKGELRKAEGSRTEIHRQHPELVVAAIKDVLQKAR